LVRDPQSILVGWRNHFSNLFSVREVSDVRQTEIHAEEPLVTKPVAFEFEMAIEKVERHNISPRIDQIPSELIKVGGEKFSLKFINLLLLFGIRTNCLRSGRSRSFCLFICRAIKEIAVIIEDYHFCKLHRKFHPISPCKG